MRIVVESDVDFSQLITHKKEVTQLVIATLSNGVEKYIAIIQCA